MSDALISAARLAPLLDLHVVTVRKLSSGRRPSIPCVRVGGALRYHWPTVAAKLGINLQAPQTPAASPLPSFLERMASPAKALPAGASLSPAGPSGPVLIDGPACAGKPARPSGQLGG
jgi:hypothetical protein